MDIEKLRNRITRNAAVNGWSAIALGGLCLVGSLLEFSVAGILVCLAAVASGCMELSGRRRLKESRLEARRWLAGSQLLLMVAVILYSVSQLLLFDPKEMMMHLSDLTQYMDPKDLQKLIVLVIHILYPALIVGTVLFQGGLWLYYTLATRKLDRAMAAADAQGMTVAQSVSPLDELRKLAQLKKEGALTTEEWTRAKELYLGKPEDK